MGSYSRSLPRTVERHTASSAGWSLRACMVRHCLAAVLQVFGQRLHSDTIPLLRVLGGSEFACLEKVQRGWTLRPNSRQTHMQTNHLWDPRYATMGGVTRTTVATSPVRECHMASHAHDAWNVACRGMPHGITRTTAGTSPVGACRVRTAPHGTSPAGVRATSGHRTRDVWNVTHRKAFVDLRVARGVRSRGHCDLQGRTPRRGCHMQTCQTGTVIQTVPIPRAKPIVAMARQASGPARERAGSIPSGWWPSRHGHGASSPCGPSNPSE